MRDLMTGFAARTAACFALLALLAGLPETAAAAKNRNLSAQDVQDLRRISDYLNTLPPLKGRFTQVSAERGKGGRKAHAKGTFYLQQPGRMRFEYDPPQQVLFISDGRFVTVEDKELESVDNYPLSDTPLHLLLKGDLDLIRDAKILALRRSPDWLQVTARYDGPGGMDGQIAITFTYPALELRQWSVLDSNDVTTTVQLHNVKKGVKLKPGLFRATDYDFEDWD